MPVHRFRSVEEMGDNAWLDPDDPRLPRVIRAVWERSRRLAPPRSRPGVRRFRSIEEKNAADLAPEAAAPP